MRGVDALAARKEEQRNGSTGRSCSISIYAGYIRGNAYISDMDTYELLYVNQHSCEVLGMPAVKAAGRKCYEVIQGRTSPCPFCTNNKITENEFYEWEFRTRFWSGHSELRTGLSTGKDTGRGWSFP